MRCFFRECHLTTDKQTKVYDLTDEIINYVLESKIKNGHIVIQPLHTTVGIYINENEKRLLTDFKNFLIRKVPFENDYMHDDIELREDCPSDEPLNCHSHLKSVFFSNPSISMIIFGGKLQMGKYQRILFAEFDGPCPRTHKSKRRYAVSIIGE
jgi:secondary thiamine-phosphate synthase enzyme